MTTTFDEREKGFENKFAHDAELMFRAEARRNKLLGLWAAELLGKKGAEAERYAQEVIVADVREGGDAAVFEKVRADIEAAGAPIDPATLRTRMNAMMVEAQEQIMAEGHGA